MFGWQIGLLAAFVHVNVYLGGSAAVNAIGHHFGRRPYDNRAGNLQWLAFVTAGEGLHNNHHAAPTSAKLSHRWFEIDSGVVGDQGAHLVPARPAARDDRCRRRLTPSARRRDRRRPDGVGGASRAYDRKRPSGSRSTSTSSRGRPRAAAS